MHSPHADWHHASPADSGAGQEAHFVGRAQKQTPGQVGGLLKFSQIMTSQQHVLHPANGAAENGTVRVFVAGDSAVMLKSLHFILSNIPGLTVAGHTTCEADAVEQINALQPDVVILDIGMRHGAGMGILKSVKRHHPAIKVMVLGECTEEFYSNRCKRAGADYFFDKAFHLARIRAVLWQWACAGLKLGTAQ
jgi:CheY-like chemotaxis protein